MKSDVNAVLDDTEQKTKIIFPELKQIGHSEIIERYKDIKLYVTDVYIDDTSAFEVAEYTKKMAYLEKLIDQIRKEAVREMKQLVEETEAPYKYLKQKVVEFKNLLKNKMTEFQVKKREADRERERKQREAKEAELKALKEAESDAEDTDEIKAYREAQEKLEKKKIVPGRSVIAAPVATSSLIQKPKYEIIDADAVPREYCEPSAGKIWNVVKGLTTPDKIAKVSIPGVRIWLEDTVAIR